jgi:4-oxalocrotonate tautomerase
MPYVRIEVTAGVTRAQKSALVADVTRSLVDNLNKRPEHIHIVIDEVAEENWGFAGQLTDDWRAKQREDAVAEPSQ